MKSALSYIMAGVFRSDCSRAISSVFIRPSDSLRVFNPGRIQFDHSDFAPMKTHDELDGLPRPIMFAVLRTKIQTGKVRICSVLSDLVMFIKTAADNSLLYLGLVR